jgi:hypothetical protein
MTGQSIVIRSMPEGVLPSALLQRLVVLAGVGQLLLVAASLAIPRVLGWREELAHAVRPLTRQLFWTYASYIWTAHLCFGLLSTFGARLLVDRTPLAGAVTAFIAGWWAVRLVLQFTYFDRTAAPPGVLFRLAEPALVTLFVALAAVYGTVAFVNFAPPR